MGENMTGYPAKSIFLGTAGWGLKVEQRAAYEVLSAFYGAGYRWVDTATNYPINGNPDKYSQTIDWLSQFKPDFPGLKIFVKGGSTTNLGEPGNLINASYFGLIFDMLVGKLSDTFGGLGVHWDNGAADSDRTYLLDFFGQIQGKGFNIGLSGVANPEIYSDSPLGRSLPWLYQVNLSPARSHQVADEIAIIKEHFPNSRICGYNSLGGISSKGLAAGENRMAMLTASETEFAGKDDESILKEVLSQSKAHGVDGLIIGPTNRAQLEDWHRAISGHSRA